MGLTIAILFFGVVAYVLYRLFLQSNLAPQGVRNTAPSPIKWWAVGALVLGAIIVPQIGAWTHSGAASQSEVSVPQGDRNAKAVSSVSLAAKISGDFTGSDQQLYQRGLEHIRNLHQKLGQYTIGQVIQDEYTRESVANEKEQEAVQAAQARHDDRAASGEHDDVAAMIRLGSQSAVFAALVRGFTISGDRLTMTLDADYWNPMSGQDRDLFKQTMYNGWATSYNQRHGTSGEHVFLDLDDLAGNQIDSYY